MTTFYTQEDLPLATEDVIVKVKIDHGVEVEHKVFAGTRVPAHLVAAWREQTDAPLSEGEIRAQEAAEAAAEELARVREAEAAARPGETPESEQGDPAPARRARTRK